MDAVQRLNGSGGLKNPLRYSPTTPRGGFQEEL